MSYKITLIPGDGIGPEITKATTKIIEKSGVKIEWEVVEAGLTALEKYHDPLPQEHRRAVAAARVPPPMATRRPGL